MARIAVGIGIASRTLAPNGGDGAAGGKVLDARYPWTSVEPEATSGLPGALSRLGTHLLADRELDQVAHLCPVAPLVGDDPRRRVRRTGLACVVDLDAPPDGPADAYLRLHLLSRRQARPHGLNLEGIFGQLENVVWTNLGPCDVDSFADVQLALLGAGVPVTVLGVDKFPRMVDYVIPSGVRIADADRVRLGAHLAAGTTVMHEGFVNFNAGTLGPSMVEGRISAGVVVGAESDLGGSASIMGTLSGGGTEVIRVGERCLVGANAGIGISLGDDCIVEAGLYVTAGTPVTVLPDEVVVKARQLSGQDGLLFRRSGTSGRIEVVPREGARWGGLNAALHAND